MVDTERLTKLTLEFVGDDFDREKLKKWFALAESRWSKGKYSLSDPLLAERILRKYPIYLQALGVYKQRPDPIAKIEYAGLDYLQKHAAHILGIEGAKHGLDPVVINDYAKVQREAYRPLLPMRPSTDPISADLRIAVHADLQNQWTKHKNAGEVFLTRLNALIAAAHLSTKSARAKEEVAPKKLAGKAKKRKATKTDFLSVQEVADSCSKTKGRISQLCNEGNISCRGKGPKRIVSLVSAQAYFAKIAQKKTSKSNAVIARSVRKDARDVERDDARLGTV